MDKSSFQRIIDEIAKKTSLDRVKAELQKVREDISTIAQHPQAQKAKQEAERRSQKLYSMINEAQKQFDKEVEKATKKLWQSTSDIESTIMVYRKRAAEEFAKLEKLIAKRAQDLRSNGSGTKKSGSTTKKAGASTTKKTAKKKTTTAEKSNSATSKKAAKTSTSKKKTTQTKANNNKATKKTSKKSS